MGETAQRRFTLKLVVRAFILAILCGLLTIAAAQVPQFSPFTADMLLKSTAGAQGPLEMNGKIFVGTGHMRLNMSMQGHETAVITDFTSKTVDILMVEPKMYMEQKAGAAPGPGMGGNPADDLKPFDPENPCANQPDITCKKIGEETVSDRNCEHWEITDKNGKVVNVWIDPKLHFPVKAVTKDATILLTNIQEGQPDASLFHVPPDFHKLDMSGMMPPGTGRPQ